MNPLRNLRVSHRLHCMSFWDWKDAWKSGWNGQGTFWSKSHIGNSWNQQLPVTTCCGPGSPTAQPLSALPTLSFSAAAWSQCLPVKIQFQQPGNSWAPQFHQLMERPTNINKPNLLMGSRQQRWRYSRTHFGISFLLLTPATTTS